MAGTTTKSRHTVYKGSAQRDVVVEYNKAVTDLETIRGAAAASVVAVTELIDDHATFKTAVDQTETLVEELHDDHATFKTAVNDLVERVNERLTFDHLPRVLYNTGCGLSIDAGANDIEMDAAISISYLGLEFPVAQEDPIDVSAKTINTNTIAQSKADAGWVFANYSGTIDMQSSHTAMTTCTTEISALSRYAVATTTLPPSAGMVPIGVVSVVEGGSGAFTWGPDSISAEGEVFYSFRGLPGVITEAASFAATGGATATFAYGAGKCRLGTGTVISYTGKTGVAFDTENKTNVTTGKTGVWLLYVLADDSEIAMQLGGAGYTTLALAQAAVRDHNPNPLMPVVGVIYVQNASGSDFNPGTTNLNAAGLTNTFTVVGTGSTWMELGRGRGQPFAALTNDAPATLSASKPASAPATLTAPAPSATAINAAGDMTAAKIGNEAGTALTD